MGAPQAEQVADRFHLLKNVVDTLKEFIGQHHNQLRKARQTIINQQCVEVVEAETVLPPCDKRSLAREQTREKRL